MWQVNHWFFSLQCCYELVKELHDSYQKCYFCENFFDSSAFLIKKIIVIFADAVILWQFHKQYLVNCIFDFHKSFQSRNKRNQQFWSNIVKLALHIQETLLFQTALTINVNFSQRSNRDINTILQHYNHSLQFLSWNYCGKHESNSLVGTLLAVNNLSPLVSGWICSV